MRESKLSGALADVLSAAAVGRRLRAWRLARGLEMLELAEGIGEARNQISQWETGRARPSIPVAFKLYREFGLPSDYLFFGSMDALPGRLVGPVKSELERLDAS